MLDRILTRRLAARLAAGCTLVASAPLFAGGLPSATPHRRPDTDARVRSRRLGQIRRWGCQYQRLDVDSIAKSDLDLIVIDDTLDGRPITSADMANMKRKPDGSRRLVLAYLSAGEAERHRPYFPSLGPPPDWLGPENPAWPGSFPTRYWLASWQQILFGSPLSWLDRILATGFDGAFLDRVDAYGDWRDKRPSAQADMANLVFDLGRYARSQSPDFLLIGQNAEALLANPVYRRAIDAVSKESLLYGLAGEGTPNRQEDIDWSLGYLKLAQNDGLALFAIEYLDDPMTIAAARTRLDAYGLIPSFANRILDRLPS